MATPDDLVHCPICLELYDQPRALPCLHTFCSTCIQEYINTAAARATSITKGFECPVCRRHTDPPGSANFTEWSSLFPLNHIILSLIDSRTDINTKKRTKELDACDKNTVNNGKRSEVASSRPPRNTAETKEAPVDDDFFDLEKKADESTIGCDEDDTNWPPPPPFLPPHVPSPHWGPPPHRPHHRHCHPPHWPPHHHGPPGHGPPPHGPPGHGPPPHGPPGHGPPPHWPPPPHHRGRGCHRPGGRFHHPH